MSAIDDHMFLVKVFQNVADPGYQNTVRNYLVNTIDDLTEVLAGLLAEGSAAGFASAAVASARLDAYTDVLERLDAAVQDALDYRGAPVMSRWPSDQWWADLQRFTDPDRLTRPASESIASESTPTEGTTTMPDATESTDIDDWRYEVANGDTRLGLADWIAHRDEANRAEALNPPFTLLRNVVEIDGPDAVWQSLTPAAKADWVAAMQPSDPDTAEVPPRPSDSDVGRVVTP